MELFWGFVSEKGREKEKDGKEDTQERKLEMERAAAGLIGPHHLKLRV